MLVFRTAGCSSSFVLLLLAVFVCMGVLVFVLGDFVKFSMW